MKEWEAYGTLASADLLTIDLSLINTPEGKKQLAQTLLEGVREKGFFYVKNFNISQERVDRQFAIGKHFYELPLEEKLKYVPDLGELVPCLSSCDGIDRELDYIDAGQFNGYVPAGRRMYAAFLCGTSFGLPFGL